MSEPFGRWAAGAALDPPRQRPPGRVGAKPTYVFIPLAHVSARMSSRRRRGRHHPVLLSVHRHRKSHPAPSARCAVKHPVATLLAR
jgi:hypothetical protein